MLAQRLATRFIAPTLRRNTRYFSISRRLLDDTKQPTSNTVTPPPPPRRKSNSDQLPLLPLVIIFFTGSFLFYRLAKSREGQGSGRGPKPPPLLDVSDVDKRKYREG
ncbi:hypothetical protein BDZ85DRAFT_263516 [Elsinoe ampelina]|uniref:Uncharacterized protein n=1 Tax=Elsinoe ampelina TaxID=302913 RepID=A0A6A6G9J4_9PEZI|nr:hypothetical protein BDZ85DRAFT_263516 [Elsinoe ampelina]